jgi:GNAT superfamily N-acetyltransferase
VARLSPLLISTEAMAKGRSGAEWGSISFDRTVAAAIALTDPRRRDRTAYLGLLHCSNDLDSLERLLAAAAELLRPQGVRRLIGPTGLSPHLGSGLLQDHWHQTPPLHTPYDPPYLPEMADIVLSPLARSRLYRLNLPADLPPLVDRPASRANLTPLASARLVTDLLPLLAAACPAWAGFLPPDVDEAGFLLAWLRLWPLLGWLAVVDSEAVGFVLLQPDIAPRLRRAGGGRNPLWRLWLNWAARRPVRRGRLLFGAVLPEWRGQGIGQQLLHQAYLTGRQQGWHSLTIGPVPDDAPANKFLAHHGAKAEQSYGLYQWDF